MFHYKNNKAIVDRGAKVGRGTKIWHFSHIMKGAKIGKDCVIGQNVFIAGGTNIGNNVKIQNNVSVYSGVTLSDGVFCGPSVVFTNVSRPRSLFPVHKNYEKTFVGEEATIGANATIVCGIDIGRRAFIGAGSVVTKDIPEYALVYGNPAELKGWVCKCGKALKSVKSGFMKCRRCKARYHKKGNRLSEV